MSFVKGLQCRECGQEYPEAPLHVCEYCFGPLEIQYDYARWRKFESLKASFSNPYRVLAGRFPLADFLFRKIGKTQAR